MPILKYILIIITIIIHSCSIIQIKGNKTVKEKIIECKKIDDPLIKFENDDAVILLSKHKTIKLLKKIKRRKKLNTCDLQRTKNLLDTLYKSDTIISPFIALENENPDMANYYENHFNTKFQRTIILKMLLSGNVAIYNKNKEKYTNVFIYRLVDNNIGSDGEFFLFKKDNLFFIGNGFDSTILLEDMKNCGTLK